ncbi:MAG: AAA family ATPase [Verrucomicrobia bacterium]|nr:AAA family ATPase [Verrucomicrobiota bacterium]
MRKDEEFVLYRGQSKDDASEVLVLSPAVEYPTSESLKRLEHEYSLKGELDPAWAARPIGIANQWDREVLVLEDPGGVPLDQLLGRPLELAVGLRLAVSLSSAIGHLHQRGLIHKNIKPANVLVNCVSGRCWLTGFGIASRLPRERQSPEAPELIAGTLAYMAPEQTGRMNRSIDSRSDLYALGVTLYEMLTGSLPFTASDPMEWVHCHIARKPDPPNKRLESVPSLVSAIIMRLLAKTAEERYQTAAGVESDLRRCLEAIGTSSRSSDSTELAEVLSQSIAPFPLGQRDLPDRLLIPEKLYGRASEIETLLAAFDRIVAGGQPELVLVSGYSGIGKSSVVNELHKPLVPPRGLFAAGKFDQYKRDVPYATLAQAFQNLLRPLLTKSEHELSNWRDTLRAALDPNGQLIVELVPELRLIIGEQPPVTELPPQDAQRRFQLVFRRFISVFARREHPLALFFDDLQWLDMATLDLLEDLLTGADMRHLMLIGAYRDNEVTSAHPLIRKLEAIRRAGGKVQDIVLAPLTVKDLDQLLADSLHCESERVTPVAHLIHEKTEGNPFFAIQFLSALAEESLLTFDHARGRWSWDLNRIRRKSYTDNVVDLLVGKLTRLPIVTQKALSQLACLGNSAAVDLLEIVYRESNQEIHGQLWEAVRTGLLFRSETSYRFLHDRVQEAAYSLVPEEFRAQEHLRIGRLLNVHTLPEKREDRVFEIVNQLNRGSSLIVSNNEREQLAELNLMAGRRAKMSTAYVSALSYLRTGRALLSEGVWAERYELIFSIEILIAECELLAANLVAAENRLSLLSQRARSPHDIAIVTRLRLTLYQTMDRSDRAVEVCLEYLRKCGTTWSLHPSRAEVRSEYDRIWVQLGNRQIEELIDLPLMTNADVLDTLDVLTEIITPAKFYDENLLLLVICRMVNLTLEHGNSDASCFAYVWFAIIAGPCFGNYKDGFRVGRLGYELVENRGLTRYQARTYMCFGQIVMPWAKHALTGRDLIRRAFDIASRIGDLTFVAYCRDELISNFLTVGDPLPEVQREAEDALEFVQKARFGLVADIITGQLGFIRTLRGLTPKFGCFNRVGFDELQFERHLTSHPILALPEFWYLVRKTQARFLAGDYASAVNASSRAEQLLWTSPSQFETAEFHFYGALARAGLFDSSFAKASDFAKASSDKSSDKFASPEVPTSAETKADLSFEVQLSRTKEEHFETLVKHHKQLALWAQNCAENFENRAALVGAEIARIEGRELDAERLYELAIRSAHRNGFVHNEAVANELAARFYASRSFDVIAHAYLRRARYCYLRWGAAGKVRQLDELYPQLREAEALPSPTSTIGTSVEHLDLSTVIKVSQAVSGEIVLEKLIDTLMRTAIEHAGADRGLLMLPRGAEQRIEAEATTSGETIAVRLGEIPEARDMVPESIVHYVARTRESVILDDAATENWFSTDPYLHRHHARSVLCLPLINQAKLIGLLYLENSLTADVFTPTRVAVLRLLASQAAISLENIQLYRALEERETKIRRLVDANIMGIYTWNLQGEILDANEAFLHIVGYRREDLASGGIRWGDLTPPQWRERDNQAAAELKATGTIQPFEKEYLRRDGALVPVLLGCASFEGSGEEGVAFVLDLSERKRAEDERNRAQDALLQAQVELARVSRIMTVEQLTSSIAHEVNQPLAAVVNSGNACLNWLSASPPNLLKARGAAERVVRDGNRASEVLQRVRALLKKAPVVMSPLKVNEVVREVLALVAGELRRQNVDVSTELDPELPSVIADFVQLQQVILNLVMNAIESMASIADRPRVLRIKSCRYNLSGQSAVLLAVSDSGAGLSADEMVRVFEAFYTTKPQGMGMGLWLCRSIIEAHGGQLTARANDEVGATFEFVLPALAEEHA